jgi:hypothetical protein
VGEREHLLEVRRPGETRQGLEAADDWRKAELSTSGVQARGREEEVSAGGRDRRQVGRDASMLGQLDRSKPIGLLPLSLLFIYLFNLYF